MLAKMESLSERNESGEIQTRVIKEANEQCEGTDAREGRNWESK